MKITYTYRGEKTTLCNSLNGFQCLDDGAVAARQYGWINGNQRHYFVEISPLEVLPTAKTLLEQLSRISGLRYDIAVSINGEPYKVLK